LPAVTDSGACARTRPSRSTDRRPRSLLIVAPLAAGSLRRTAYGLIGLALCLAGIVVIGTGNPAETASSAAFAVGSWTAGRVLQAGAAALRSAAAPPTSSTRRIGGRPSRRCATTGPGSLARCTTRSATL
jgi:hypothetical protein